MEAVRTSALARADSADGAIRSALKGMSEGASHSPMSVAVGAAAAVAVGGLLFGAYRKARAQGRRVLTISVPATTANLGCGFDAFGAALDMYMTLRAEVAANQSATSFTYEGEGANEVALDESNMIWKSAIACQTMWAPGRRMPKLAVHVRNSVPFGRGLGSSATAIIAGVGASLGFACRVQGSGCRN